MSALYEIRLTGVRLRIERPDHPHADAEGRVEVEVRQTWRGRREVVEALSVVGTQHYLTPEERTVAVRAINEREALMEAGKTW